MSRLWGGLILACITSYEICSKLGGGTILASVITMGNSNNQMWFSSPFHSSHLVTIPPGTLLSDALRQSPIIVGEDGSGAMPGMAGSGGEFDFGFDPSTDPELAMVRHI